MSDGDSVNVTNDDVFSCDDDDDDGKPINQM